MANKSIKSKDKEINRLEHKNDNLEDSVKAIKIENKRLVDEKKKVTAEKIKLEKKLIDKQPVKKIVVKTSQCNRDTD